MACQGCAEAQQHAAKAAPDPLPQRDREIYARGYRDGAEEGHAAALVRARATPSTSLPPMVAAIVEGLALGLVAYATLRLARQMVGRGGAA